MGTASVRPSKARLPSRGSVSAGLLLLILARAALQHVPDTHHGENMEPTNTGELTHLTDPSNGILLPRYLVTSLNVGDLTSQQTGKQGTRYEIFPKMICVAKKASWGISIVYNEYVEAIEDHYEELNKVESPWHWLRVNIRKAEILCDPIDFTWDTITLDMEGAENLAIDVLQRIGNDFLFRTNAIAQRQMMF